MMAIIENTAPTILRMTHTGFTVNRLARNAFFGLYIQLNIKVNSADVLMMMTTIRTTLSSPSDSLSILARKATGRVVSTSTLFGNMYISMPIRDGIMNFNEVALFRIQLPPFVIIIHTAPDK